MRSNRKNFSLFNAEGESKIVKTPCLFYVENNNPSNKRSFYILGTHHTLPLTVFSETIQQILKNQSNLYAEHSFSSNIIMSDFEFFQINKIESLIKWWDLLEDDIKKILMKVFDGIDSDLYAKIHPKFYLFSVILKSEYQLGLGMDSELISYYKDSNKPVNYLESHRQILNSINTTIDIGLKSISHFFNLNYPHCLRSFDLNSANHWSTLFNFFLQEKNYQKYSQNVKSSLSEGIEKYMEKNPKFKPITRKTLSLIQKKFDDETDERSNAWYHIHFPEMNECLTMCGVYHLFKRRHALLKTLSEDGFDIYQMDNEGNKHIFNVTEQIELDNTRKKKRRV